jgi:hypothetical protein
MPLADLKALFVRCCDICDLATAGLRGPALDLLDETFRLLEDISTRAPIEDVRRLVDLGAIMLELRLALEGEGR